MAKCQITKRSSLNGNRVSHSNIKTKHKLKVNVQKKRIFNIKSGTWMRLKISTRALRTFTKKHFYI